MPLEVDIETALTGLDEGERQSICLAASLKKDVILLIDDRAGRMAAESLNIPKIGLIGLLLLAKKNGQIESIGALLQQLRTNGYWLSNEVLAVAQKLAEE